MEIYYLLDYFLLTFFASLGVIQIALGKKNRTKIYAGLLITLLPYLWFFGSKDRNIPTMVEVAQLFFIFGIALVLAIITTKLFNVLNRNAKYTGH